MWQCHLSAQDYRYYPVDGYSLLKRFPLHPLTGPRCPVQTVGQWLESIGLPQYENHLMANGFDNVQFMVRLLSVATELPFVCLCFLCVWHGSEAAWFARKWIGFIYATASENRMPLEQNLLYACRHWLENGIYIHPLGMCVVWIGECSIYRLWKEINIYILPAISLCDVFPYEFMI